MRAEKHELQALTLRGGGAGDRTSWAPGRLCGWPGGRGAAPPLPWALSGLGSLWRKG